MPWLTHEPRRVQCAISDHVSAVVGALTRSLGRMLATGMSTETRLTISSPYCEIIQAALASYDAVSEASVMVLYQRLRTLLLLDPPTPGFIIKMRGVVANNGMRALGLAPINEGLDNAVIVFLLAAHWLGGGGMGSPVIKCVQDSAITILAGLQHDSVAVRPNYKICLHMQGTVREICFQCEMIQRQLDVCNSCGIM